MNKKREIYVRIDNLPEVVEKMQRVKKREEEIKKLFQNYDELNLQESKIYESWNNYIEDIFSRVDHITL